MVKAVCVSEGQRADMKIFSQLWAQGDWQHTHYFIADKGYDFHDVRKPIHDANKQPVIPRRKGAICPGILPQYKEHYKTRVAIKHFFGRLKENKRMALRFDKLDATFLSFFAIACLKIFKLLC